MIKKIEKIHVIKIILFLIFISIISINYTTTQNNIKNQYEESFQTLESVENIIIVIHEKDSELYQKLLITDTNNLASFEHKLSSEEKIELSNTITDLFNNINEDKIKTSIHLDINTIFEIERLKSQIIELHKLRLVSTQENYDIQINQLLREYDELIKRTINALNQNIYQIKEDNLEFQEMLQMRLLIFNFIITILFIISLCLTNTKEIKVQYQLNKDTAKPQTITLKRKPFLDPQLNAIIQFIEDEINRGIFPTIKDIKLKFNLTHPTVLTKLKCLEDKNIISFKKQGRNKFIVLNIKN